MPQASPKHPVEIPFCAEQILSRFSQTARDEVEMEALQTELLHVVQETMQPERAFIWLKKDVVK
jgi:hypothetical protein